jgi:hypothetical protein
MSTLMSGGVEDPCALNLGIVGIIRLVTDQ